MTDSALQSAAPAAAKVETPFQRFRAEFFESRIAATAFVVLSIIILLAILAPWITPQNPYDLAQVDVLDGRLPPGSEAFAGYTMWLGSDGAGRDLYSAILYGLRISISVGLASGVIALVIGMTVGLIAAYAGGRTEAIIMRVVDLQLSFPASLVALMLVAALGKGVDKIILALVVAQWAYYARTVRATALVERGKEYVEAA
ncbi:MAG: ABC transporter permease, partial [Pseudomonadota bacterium]